MAMCNNLRSWALKGSAEKLEWRAKPQCFIGNNIGEWRRRLQCVVDQNGRHTEHTFH